MLELLKELCIAKGTSGHEHEVIEIMRRELKKTCDEVSVDAMGNVIGIKKSKNPQAKSIMISGHMDEIGLVVTHIDDNGFIRAIPRGGQIPRVLINQRVTVCGKKTLQGVVEGMNPFFGPPDERVKAPEIKDMFIDVGYTSGKDLRKIVSVGDMIVFNSAYEDLGKSIMSKALDNRVGCYLVLEAMKRLDKSKKKLDVNIYAVGSTQEEVGVRGAVRAARNLKPDFGIALDVTCAAETPGVAPHLQVTRLGKGTAIKVQDSANLINPGMIDFMKSLAEKNKIKYQMEILPSGGTDGHAMQLFGEGSVAVLSVPTRYVHSPSEMIHKDDLEATVKLLVKVLENGHNFKLRF